MRSLLLSRDRFTNWYCWTITIIVGIPCLVFIYLFRRKEGIGFAFTYKYPDLIFWKLIREDVNHFDNSIEPTTTDIFFIISNYVEPRRLVFVENIGADKWILEELSIGGFSKTITKEDIEYVRNMTAILD